MENQVIFIKNSIAILEKDNLLHSLDNTGIFYDEPHYFYYSALLHTSKKYMKKYGLIPIKRDISTGGISFNSREEALSKCLGEAIERLCLASCPKDTIIYDTYTNLSRAINPSLYSNTKDIHYELFGWIKGKEIATNKDIYIPAQTLFTDYPQQQEPYLCPHISTGAAGGFSHYEILLAGLQEVIERDTYMTIYLNKISAPKIDYTTIPHTMFQAIVANIQRYNLELHIFDITNDLEIPTFMVAIIDRTGLGPAITIGTKTGVNRVSTIIKALSEALMSRPLVRYTMYKQKSSKILSNKDKLIQNKDRLFLWSSQHMLPHLDFLLDQKPIAYRGPLNKITPQEEITFILHKLQKKGFNPTFADITTQNFKPLAYSIYKVVIPGLQPLYLEEKKKYLNRERLHNVAKFFGKQPTITNTIPHPFL